MEIEMEENAPVSVETVAESPVVDIFDNIDKDIKQYDVTAHDPEEPAAEVEAEPVETAAPEVEQSATTATPATQEPVDLESIELEKVTPANIDEYFKTPDVYKAIHNECKKNNSEYKEICGLLEDSDALQQALMANNETFATTDDVNLKADILVKAKEALTNQMHEALDKYTQSYREQVGGHVMARQLNQYMSANADNLAGVNKLTNSLYSVIVDKAGLADDSQTQSKVGDAINNAFLGIAKQFNINPKELVDVVEKYGGREDMKEALDQLKSSSQTSVSAQERAKSITMGGSDVSEGLNKLSEIEQLMQRYSIN